MYALPAKDDDNGQRSGSFRDRANSRAGLVRRHADENDKSDDAKRRLLLYRFRRHADEKAILLDP